MVPRDGNRRVNIMEEMMKLFRLAAWPSAVVVFAGPFAAPAQDYPSKNVQYIIPFVPGGESDVMARWQQTVFRNKYKRDMIVINKPGAGGGLAWSQLNSLSADGYTIVGCNLPHIVLQPLEGQVQYKTADITPAYWFHYTADAIIVAADSPFKTFGEMVKAGRAKSDSLTFGGSATFSANHLAHEKFNAFANVKSTYVPFKGTGELVAAVVGKHVTGAMSYVPLALQQKRVRMRSRSTSGMLCSRTCRRSKSWATSGWMVHTVAWRCRSQHRARCGKTSRI
jgi:tripartite-type tricarboxylate transporter receptor subunit TctC